jgi:hypothetical protein
VTIKCVTERTALKSPQWRAVSWSRNSIHFWGAKMNAQGRAGAAVVVVEMIRAVDD